MYSYKKRNSKVKNVLILLLLIIIVSATSIFVYRIYADIDVKSYEENIDNIPVKLSQNIEQDIENSEVTSTLEEVTKCVVGISKIRSTGSSVFLNNSTSELGLGTGIIVSENGYILTNWHVAGNKYSTCYITLENGNTHNGSVVWADSDLDLAIVKINAKGLKYLNLGDSDNLKLGKNVYAIGNPIGLEFQRTITSGIISGLNRTIKIEEDNNVSYMEDLIQTDATINPGNSGGPLINTLGEVIGINTIKIKSAEGIGFAVPINIIKPIIESYIKSGSFEEAYLGIFAYDKEVIPYLDSNIDFNSGIYVAQISSDGPCKNINLKVGDIITKIDNYEINKMSELRNYIYMKKPNDKVDIAVLRNNKEYNLKVTLGRKG